MKDHPVEISVAIPVYNSEKILNELFRRLRAVLEGQLKRSFEIVFVDDHSSDHSWKILDELCHRDSRLKAIRLVRNFGQHNATLCGLNYCSGRYVVTMDDDLQHAPEDIPLLISALEEDRDVVFGVFTSRKHGFIRNLTSKLIDVLQIPILNKPKQLHLTTFRAMRHEVVERITAKAKSAYCYLAADILKYASHERIANIQVTHHPRRMGRSNYSFFKMLSLASNLVINHSAFPLRFMIYSGFLISVGCIFYALHLLFRVIFEGPIKIAGWASLAFLVTFLFGMMFMFFGILGEYVFRILREISGDEPYIIRESRGINRDIQEKA